MGTNLSIFKKGLFLVAIPFAAQLLFLMLLFKTRAAQEEAQHWALHTKDVIAESQLIVRSVIEANAATRGYVITGDAAFVKDFQQTVVALPAKLAELQNLVQDNPPQQEKAQVIGRRVEENLAWLRGTNELVQTGQRAEAVGRVGKLGGNRLLHDLQVLTDQFLVEEQCLDGERQERLKQSSANVMYALMGGTVVILLSTVLLLHAFSSGIGRRLRVLSDNARQLAAGQALASPLTGSDELSQLDRVFHDMAKSLEQKDRENEMFVYSVSHDLRSPLVNLQGFSQELAMVCKDLRGLLEDNELPEAVRQRGIGMIDRDAQESIRFIQTAVRRLAEIIDSLLRLSRVGRVVYRMQPVDVGAAVGRVVTALKNSLGQKGAEVALRELPTAWADPAAVEQIFANLIGNAVNYLDPKRPGKIEVGVKDGAEIADSPGTRTYYVKDNGLGIPKDHQAKVFVAFQRLHPEAATGEGIGLALIRRVVERHGGRIWLESVAGEGSTFFVALPSSPPASAAITETKRPRIAAAV